MERRVSCRARGFSHIHSYLAKSTGYILKRARLAAGYASPHSLSRAITDITGIDVSERSIYRYEQGQTFPNVEALYAVSQTLDPDLFLDMLAMIFCHNATNISITQRRVRHKSLNEQMQLFNTDRYV